MNQQRMDGKDKVGMLLPEKIAEKDHTIILHELLMAIIGIEPADVRLVLPASIKTSI
jgi:hypothetical protein